MITQGKGLVLVAEDDADLRGLLMRILTQRGYTVITAANGREAWEKLHAAREPMVLVTDVRMPLMSGLDVLIMLRHEGSRVPVVLISGYADGVAHEGHENGAVVLAKPFSGVDLLSAIARAPDAVAEIFPHEPVLLRSAG